MEEHVSMSDKYTDYLFVPASLLIVLSLLDFQSVATARRGNVLGMLGMALAIVSTLAHDEKVTNGGLAAAAILPAFVVGVALSLRAKMTELPQLVGLFNGLGGLSAALASFSFYAAGDDVRLFSFAGCPPLNYLEGDNYDKHFVLLSVELGVVIGVFTFTGSLVAAAKLAAIIPGRAVVLPARHHATVALLAGVVALCVLFHLSDSQDEGRALLGGVAAIAGVLGILMVLSIGGGDAPVVIGALNMLSGGAGLMAGLTAQNPVLILGGSIVFASGAILSHIMCRAMNRAFFSVMMGGFGSTAASKAAAKAKAAELEASGAPAPEAQLVGADDVARLLAEARSVVIVPGYGMAVAQAQHTVSSIAKFLISSGRTVRAVIHEVAGRLPGHMQVLLAEANFPYDQMLERSECSHGDMAEVDVAVVIGANDTVNPAAVRDPSSTIAGMPVTEVWRAKRVVVLKRSLATGYAGISNELFYHDNTSMLLGDARKTLDQVYARLQELVQVDEAGDEAARAAAEAAARVSPEEERKERAEKERAEQERVRALPASMTVAVPAEADPEERRVAVTPATARRMREQGFQVVVRAGAGERAGFGDDEYRAWGARVADTDAELYGGGAQLVLGVRGPATPEQASALPEGAVLICMLDPRDKTSGGTVEALAARGCTLLSMPLVPRISRAQKLDALSSMASVAGNRAVTEAAHEFGRFFSGIISAAGRTRPASVLVVGAGVAGLAAIGAARSMGAIVRAFDVRPAVKEEVESMGAEFLMLHFGESGDGGGGYAKIMSDEFIAKEMELFRRHAPHTDVCITTAMIPGRAAPKLWMADMVDLMPSGSVVVDVAAGSGGNCEVTRPGERFVTDGGVTVLGYTDMPSRMPAVSSQLYSSNICHLLDDMGGAEGWKVDEDDVVVSSMMVLRAGESVWPKPRKPQQQQAPPKDAAAEEKKDDGNGAAGDNDTAGKEPSPFAFLPALVLVLGTAAFLGVLAPNEYHLALIVCALSSVLGYLLVWGITAQLHTPLMSLTNALSGLVLLGGLEQVGGDLDTPSSKLAFAAVVFAALNVSGGFAITTRMIEFFQK